MKRQPGEYFVRERVSGEVYKMKWVETSKLKLQFWMLNGYPLGTQPQDSDVICKVKDQQ